MQKENRNLRISLIAYLMRLISLFLNHSLGKIHLKVPSRPTSDKSYAFFLHGASRKTQNTDFWEPLLARILDNCNPILMDRLSHGKSTLPHSRPKVSHQDHLDASTYSIQSISKRFGIQELILIGRSYGGQIALQLIQRLPKIISGLGLIAPSGGEKNRFLIRGWNKPLNILWDVMDPVIPFAGHSIFVDEVPQLRMYTIGKSSFAKKFTTRENRKIPPTHTPELHEPELFDDFLRSLCKS
ncbi:MAG: alpha/beta fold hydrolase [Candidatus Thorarchaeota archaeon]